MCLRLNTSAGAMSASITVQRAALFAVVAMSKAHVTGRANTWSGATMINRRLLIYGAPKAATGGTLTVGNVGGDPDLTEQLYEFFRANVGNTVPCEISDAMPQPWFSWGQHVSERSDTVFNRRLFVSTSGGVAVISCHFN